MALKDLIHIPFCNAPFFVKTKHTKIPETSKNIYMKIPVFIYKEQTLNIDCSLFKLFKSDFFLKQILECDIFFIYNKSVEDSLRQGPFNYLSVFLFI
jgi:hypothetical protein